MWSNRNTKVLDCFSPQNGKLTLVLCDQVTQCLSSLTISLVSTTGTNGTCTIQSKRILDHTWLHTSITWHVWTAAHALISSRNRLNLRVAVFKKHLSVTAFKVINTHSLFSFIFMLLVVFTNCILEDFLLMGEQVLWA